MNLRIENAAGYPVLKIAAHKSNPGLVVLKIPAGCAPLAIYLSKWCATLGVSSLGNAWAGGNYWMQEADKGQVMGAVERLLAGEALPEVDIPSPAEVLGGTGPQEEEQDDEQDEVVEDLLS